MLKPQKCYNHSLFNKWLIIWEVTKKLPICRFSVWQHKIAQLYVSLRKSTICHRCSLHNIAKLMLFHFGITFVINTENGDANYQALKINMKQLHDWCSSSLCMNAYQWTIKRAWICFPTFYSHICPWNWSTALQMRFYIKVVQNSYPSDIVAYLFTNNNMLSSCMKCSLHNILQCMLFCLNITFTNNAKMLIFAKITNFRHQKELWTGRMIYAALASVWTYIYSQNVLSAAFSQTCTVTHYLWNWTTPFERNCMSNIFPTEWHNSTFMY